MADNTPPQEPSSSGWYSDPSSGETLRWWDGQEWATDVGPVRGRRQRWITESPLSLSISRLVAGVALVGMVTAAAIVVDSLIRSRAIPGGEVLLLPAIPAVAFGQLWAIGLMNAREPKQPKAARARISSGQARRRSGGFFVGLPQFMRVGLAAVFFCGWVTAVTAFPSLSLGSPTQGSIGCPWALNSHGKVSCVSHDRFNSAAAGGERLAAGVMMGFFAVHLGVATAEVRRRRSNGPTGSTTHPVG